MRAMLIVVLVLVTGVAARGWAEDPPTPAPIDWSFLQPGKTTQEQAVERAGKPQRAWKSVLEKGVIDLEPTTHRNASAFGVPIPRTIEDPARQIAVDVLAWPGPTAARDVQLVFFQGRLLYALLIPGSQENTPSLLEERYGELGASGRTAVASGCIVNSYLTVTYAAQQVAYLAQATQEGISEFVRKVRWCKAGDFTPELAGVEWKLPPAPTPAK